MICEECGCEMVQQEGCERCPVCGEGPACGGVTIHPGMDERGAGVRGEGMEPALREGNDAQRSDGGELPRLPDGSPLPEDLARQVRFLEEHYAEKVEALRRDGEECIQRFIAAYPKYGNGWREKDLLAEAREERLDQMNYQAMGAMREAGV